MLVYDYFVGRRGRQRASRSSQSSRWTEIATRLRDIHGLSRQTDPRRQVHRPAEPRLDQRDDPGVARGALAGGCRTRRATLAELEARGVITYRAFADEYRIWQGTDIDIRRLLDGAHERMQQNSLFEILSGMEAPLTDGGGAAQCWKTTCCGSSRGGLPRAGNR